MEDHVRPGISVQPHYLDSILPSKLRRVGEQNVPGMSKEAVPQIQLQVHSRDAHLHTLNGLPKFLWLSGGLRVALSGREGGRELVSPICSECFRTTCAIEYTISRDIIVV